MKNKLLYFNFMLHVKLSILLLLGVVLVILNSCDQIVTKETYEAGVELAIDNEKVIQDSLEKLYIETLDEIDNNLDKIRDREGVIIMGPKSNSDLNTSKKAQIVNNISMINSLLEDNKSKLAILEESLLSYKSGKKEFLNSISQAKKRIIVKENDINNLKKILTQKEFKITELNNQLKENSLTIDSLNIKNELLDKDLNRVYYTFGTSKELILNNIIIKEGGVLGMGKVLTLQQNFEKSKFTELNQKETTTINFKGKKPKLISKHPVNSYNIITTENNNAQLNITDPTHFWSLTKYLVIEVEL